MNTIKILEESSEPPSNKTRVGIGSRFLLANHFILRRFKGIWELWGGDWSIPFFGVTLPSRCLLISTHLQEEVSGRHGAIRKVVT